MRLPEDLFALFKSDVKTIEIRVNDTKRQAVRLGQTIRFCCGSESLVVKVKKVTLYASFEQMLDNEPLSAIHPYQGKEEQLTFLRQLYPPEKESLGVLAFTVTRVTTKG